MNDDELNDLWIGAFRYYLGRRTISVSTFCTALIKHKDAIPEVGKVIIKQNLKKAITEDDESRLHGFIHKPLGHDCDRAAWLGVYSALGGD